MEAEKCVMYLVRQGVAALPEFCRIYRQIGDGAWLGRTLETLSYVEEYKASKIFELYALAKEMGTLEGTAARALLLIRIDALESHYICNPAMLYEAEFGEGTWPSDIPVESFGSFKRW